MTKQLENIETYAEEVNKQNLTSASGNTELIQTAEVEGTPFTIIKHEENYFVTLGRYRLTEGMDKEQAIQDAKREDWERIMQVIGIMIENYKTEINN